MTTAIIPQDTNLQLPAAMEGATAFEVYVFMHRDNRTIGQIKKCGRTKVSSRYATRWTRLCGWVGRIYQPTNFHTCQMTAYRMTVEDWGPKAKTKSITV